MSTTWTTADIPDQSGRTFVVTGANSGIGLEITRELARRGAHVIMAVRGEVKGRAAADGITDALPGADLEVRRLDLADLESVTAFAERLRSDGVGVDVLVNNAGIMGVSRSLSPQGHELQFAVNHLGHFALTGLLLDRIERGREPRVVTVSSIAHKRGRIHFDDLTGEGGYSHMGRYRQSKLANALFGLELDRRLRAADSPVSSVLAHPGVSATNLVSNGFFRGVRTLINAIGSLMSQPVEAGALPELYAATDPRVEGGQFIGPDGRNEIKGGPTVVRPIAAAEDRETARRLWTLSEELTGVSYHLPATA